MIIVLILTIIILTLALLALGIRLYRQSFKLKGMKIAAQTEAFIRQVTKDAILVLDMNGEILEVNPALTEFLHMDQWNIIGKNLNDPREKFADPDLFQRILQAAHKNENGVCGSFIYEFTDSGRHRYPLEIDVCLLPAHGFKEERLLCISKNIESQRDVKGVLLRRNNVEELLGRLISKAFSTVTADMDIASILENAGDFLNARRSFLFQYNDKQDKLVCKALWNAEGTQPLKEDCYELPAEIVQQFFYSEDDDFVVIQNLAENERLPEQYREITEINQSGAVVASVLAVKGEQPFGFVDFVFDSPDPEIDDSAVIVLRVVSEILTGLLAKSSAAREKALFQQCVDAAGQGIAMIDEDGRPFYTNKAYRELIGNKADGSEPVWTSYEGSYQEKVEKFILPLVRRGERWSGELAIANGKDTLNTLESFFPIEQTGTHPTLVADIITNISAQKRLEKQLTEARKEADLASRKKSDYLANMSHEIRNPMNAIIGLSYLCLQTDLKPRQHDYMSKVYSSAQTLLGIINKILDLSKIESGKLELEQSTFTLDGVLENLANLTTEPAAEKELEYLFHRAPNTNGYFLGDPLRIGQILLNLVSNAIKFTANGSVQVSVEQSQPGFVRFTVQDTGIGMNPDQLEHLFGAFQQADASTSRKYGGTGLGLAISKQLIGLMDGRIEVESQPGKGSRFSFVIRLDRPQKQIPDEEPHMPEELKGTAAFSVASNDLKRKIHAEALSSVGFQVSSCASMKEALESPIHPRVIILDVDVCRGDCVTAMNALSVGEIPAPIVLISGKGGYDAFEHAGVPEGFQQLLPLPYSYRQLKSAIISSINGSLSVKNMELEEDNGKTVVQGRILLAEDDEINQQVATELLSRAGLVIDIAEDGQEAVRMCERQSYNLVLMDIHMPKMSGYESASEIRRRHPALPIVAMTASALGTIRTQLRESAFNDYLSKPIEPEALYRVVSKALSLPAAAFKTQLHRDRALAEETRIPGLNEEAALGFILGNRVRYRQILHRFSRNFSDFSGRMGSCIRENLPDKAISLLHELRGAAGIVGADGIKETAGTLEEELRAGANLETIRWQSLGRKLEKLIRDIETRFQNGSTAVRGYGPDSAFFNQLEDMVRHGDTRALLFLETEIPSEEKLAGENWKAHIHAALVRQDFDSALNIIDGWRTAIQR